MKRKNVPIGLVIIPCVVICIGMYFAMASPKEETFSGINGETISVRTTIDSKTQRKDTESESVKAGDIIEAEGSKEIVIGVSADGRYITMPLEDYENQNN